MDIKPTRMGLLLIKKKLKLATKGYKLLKDKQDALILEFFGTLKDIRTLRGDIAVPLKKADESIARAQGISGFDEIESIASGMTDEATFEINRRNIMGVGIPEIEEIRPIDEWHSHLSGDIELDSAILKYRNIFPHFLKLIEKQITLNHIAEDIKRTRRKVNSLEYIIMPKYEKTKKRIQFKLEEQERENFSRLKKVKSKNKDKK